MRVLLGIVAGLVAAPLIGYAAVDGLDWAYPVNPPPGAANADTAESPKNVNRNQILASYTGLPQMPAAVFSGKPLPCMQCHLANGNGHPESADISGLPVNYIIEQVHAYRDEERVDTRTKRMVAVAKIISDKDLQAAAEYYSAIPRERQQWIRTVVSEEAPKGEFTFGPGSYRYHAADGSMEPIPQGRVIMTTADDDLVRARDQIAGGFVQYVRPDDLALGETLVTTGGDGKTTKCATCHGADLQGKGDTPRLAGRETLYLIRALNDMRAGANKNKKTAVMKSSVAKLSDRDIVAISAYLASKAP